MDDQQRKSKEAIDSPCSSSQKVLIVIRDTIRSDQKRLANIKSESSNSYNSSKAMSIQMFKFCVNNFTLRIIILKVRINCIIIPEYEF